MAVGALQYVCGVDSVSEVARICGCQCQTDFTFFFLFLRDISNRRREEGLVDAATQSYPAQSQFDPFLRAMLPRVCHF